ncbi:glycerol-3-phosphate 1-O-acyltransferase PlsY [Bacillus horti]|uniref:Glycerol-3-phosphate acyltransferase n=1 Tax=Caldalkalibacillus horti TaxID=77523 RepID=A0ABT9W6N3_9BACI|nr:glycerol-3-phosphate 1-O-acyltransferase PlsY [Bacillus horti]MDQ0168510.1 glycerol-3-phosphate acyltransferase PlsY [Bacillus horti]
MAIFIACLVAYLLGSISFSFLIAKKIAGIDIRQHGSNNAGTTNTLRVLGKLPALLVLILDTLKGSVAVLIAMQLTDSLWVWMLAGFLAIIGHNWPVFFGFRGGKGVATTIGVVIALMFIPALYAGVIAIALIVIFRYVSLGSLAFVTLLPISLLLLQRPMEFVVGSLAILLLSYWRHRTNIVRLFKGQENKLGKKVAEHRG